MKPFRDSLAVVAVALVACTSATTQSPSPHERVLATTETGPAADNYRVTMSIVSQVTPSGTGSRVSTQLTAYAEDMGSSKGGLSCLTLGALEQRINQLTMKHLGG